MAMKTVEIVWKAFEALGEETHSCKIQVDADIDNRDLCNDIFKDTNVYEGKYWDLIEKVMPEERSHTALSVGDELIIDGTYYRVEPFGWATPKREVS